MLDRDKKTFLSLVVMHMLGDCYGGVWPMFKKIEEIDLAFAGLVATATIVLGQGIQPLLGILSDHGRQRQFVVFGTALTCMTMLVGPIWLVHEGGHLSRNATYAIMFVVMLIARFGQGLFHPAGASVSGNLSHVRRSTIVATFITFGMIGMALSQMTMSLAYYATGGNTAWMLLPASVIVLTGAIWFRPNEHTQDHKVNWRAVYESLAPVRGQLISLYFFQVAWAFIANALIFLMPEFMESRGCSAWLVNGGGLVLWIGGSVLLMIVGGHIADRIGQLLVFRWSAGIALVLYFIMLLVPMPVPTFLLILVLTGGFVGMMHPLGISLGQQLVPRHHASMVSGILMGMAWALGSMANLIVGILAKMPQVGITNALVITGSVCVVGFALAFVIRGPAKAAT
jgi:MFS family permease